MLHLHGIAALALVFLLPLGESAIFLGFIFPGETAAILAGVLAYQGIHLAEAFAAVVLGAVIGDTIGYAIGFRWGTKLLQGPLSRFITPAQVERSRALIRRRGGWAVVLGRFTAALRVLVPGLAGTAEMPYRRFLAFNATGGLLWGVTYVLVGYLAGASWRTAAHTAGTAGLAALVAAVIVIAVIVLVRRHRHRTGAPADPPE